MKNDLEKEQYNNIDIKICKKCGKELKKGNNFCTNCGAPIGLYSTKKIDLKLKLWQVIIIIFIIIIVLMMLIFMNNKSKNELKQSTNYFAKTKEDLEDENKNTENKTNEKTREDLENKIKNEDKNTENKTDEKVREDEDLSKIETTDINEEKDNNIEHNEVEPTTNNKEEQENNNYNNSYYESESNQDSSNNIDKDEYITIDFDITGKNRDEILQLAASLGLTVDFSGVETRDIIYTSEQVGQFSYKTQNPEIWCGKLTYKKGEQPPTIYIIGTEWKAKPFKLVMNWSKYRY